MVGRTAHVKIGGTDRFAYLLLIAGYTQIASKWRQTAEAKSSASEEK